MLISLWKFISLFPKLEVLFDSDTEIGGVYDAEALDPELSRPASAVLWELLALRHHKSPLVGHFARFFPIALAASSGRGGGGFCSFFLS